MTQVPFTIRRVLLPAVAAALAFGAQGQSAPQGAAPGTAAGQSAQSAGAAPGSGDSPASQGYRGLRASQMIGMSVRGSQGENVGQIRDLIVNLGNAVVRYAVLEFDPGILAGARLVPVPVEALRMGAGHDALVYSGGSRRDLSQIAMNTRDWNDRVLGDLSWMDRVARFWGQEQQPRGETARRASTLIGKEVNDSAGRSIGQLEELVVNMANARVHYAVLNLDPSWIGGERRVALPLTALSRGSREDGLRANLDPQRIRGLPEFRRDQYGLLNDRSFLADLDRSLPRIGATGAAGAADTGVLGAGGQGGTPATGPGSSGQATGAGAAGTGGSGAGGAGSAPAATQR